MKIQSIKLFALSAAVLGFSSEANAICLDYWIKGPSACKPEAQEKTVVIKGGTNLNLNIEKDAARIEYEDNLNLQIDKFIEGYGKPPREFVAFHLDPTLENAVRWVKKFEDDYDRTRKIAIAWKQADKLFKEYKETGTLKLSPESGVTERDIQYVLKALEERPSDLKPVKGFSKDLEGDWETKVLNTDYSKLEYKNEPYSQALDNFTQTKAAPKQAAKKQEDNKPVKGTENLEISYYFSAKCPYCVKFKPQLQKAINDYGKDKVKLTCVDMTPGKQSPDNIGGGLECKWRPILAGEAKQYGVKSTPSLLVKRSGTNTLDLIENYYSSEVLYKYFKKGS